VAQLNSRILALFAVLLLFHLSSGCGEKTSIVDGEKITTDQDGDGLNQWEEEALGTNDSDADTDDDGLTDFEEVIEYQTNPLNADSDRDGIKDLDELKTYGTDPTNNDSDDDSVNDGQEILDGTDPNDSADLDFDGDGVSVLTDCDDTDPDRYPGASDTWSNGVDLNCKPDVTECITPSSVNLDGSYAARIILNSDSYEPYSAIGFGAPTDNMGANPISCKGRIDNLSGTQECSLWDDARGWKVEKRSEVRFRIYARGQPVGGGTGTTVSCDVGD
jgi:hypothetical protein